MSSIDPLSDALKDALELKPMRAELSIRVAASPPRVTRRAPWIAAGSLAALAAGVAAVALLVAAPRRALAQEIMNAARNVHGRILVYWLGPGETRTLHSQCWISGGRSRISFGANGEGAQEFIDLDHDRAVLWNPLAPGLTFFDGGVRNHMDFDQLIAGGDFASLIARLEKFHPGPPKTGQTTFEGRSVDYLELNLKFSSETIQETFYADPADHHILGFRDTTWAKPPFTKMMREDWQRQTGPDGKEIDRSDALGIVDTTAIAPERLEPVFRIDGEDVDVYRERSAFKDRFAKVLATVHNPAGTVRVRDLARNAYGDLFVLYTSGAKPEAGPLCTQAGDSAGGRFLSPSQGRTFRVSESGWKRLYYDGEPLQGAWFIPAPGPNRAGPVTLTFQSRGGKPSEVTLTPSETIGELPEYMLYFGSLRPRDVRFQDFDSRGEWLLGSGKCDRAIETFRKALAVLAETGQDSAWIREEVGLSFLHLHRYPQAIQELKIAESLSAGPNQAEKVKEDILRVQNLMRAP